jgi:two-component system phosphate regulon sensor histidine kinase PhoR
MQVYWVNHAMELRKKEFNRKVNAALQSVSGTLRAVSPAERINAGQYLLPIARADKAREVQLQELLAAAFAKNNIQVDFEFAIYDKQTNRLDYGGIQHMPGAYEHKEEAPFPVMGRNFSYIGIYFPNLSWYIFTGTYIWLMSSLVVVALMCFLCYLVFRAYRQKQLEEIQKDFVSNVSHEFQTPLSAIKLSAGVLQDPAIADSPQRLQRYAAIIQQEAEKLTSHIEQVLQTKDVEKHKPALNKTSFEWQEVLKDVVEQAAKKLECVDGQIALHLPEKPVKFRGDILHLSNAIGNLVDNAIKYCDNTPIIHIFLKNKGKQLYITVRDNGIGIDKQYQKWLFNKFYRVPTGNVHNVKGVGLGLSYVFYIARSHGGTLSCNSKPGAGSAFTLSFPQK